MGQGNTGGTSASPRVAGPADAHEIVRLRRLMFEAMGVDLSDDRWEAAALAAIPAQMEAGRLVAIVVDAPDDSGFLAASGVVQFESRLPSPGLSGAVKGYVSSISTDAKWRRNGFAGLVLDRLLHECRDRGATVVELHATDAGRSLYERVGFRLRTGGPEMRWTAP